MKSQVIAATLVIALLAGCTTTNRNASNHIQPEWQVINGMTKSEIADYLYKNGDDTIVRIHVAARLIEERRTLLSEKEGKEAEAEVKKLGSLLKAYEEQIFREVDIRYNSALSEAQKKQ